MRSSVLSLTACAALMLSGCSQISGWLHGDSRADTEVSDAALRNTPNQSYEFADAGSDVIVYGNSAGHSGASYTNYSGYEVILYDTDYGTSHGSSYGSAVNYAPADPREAAFVKLNGTSENSDWQNCETLSRGYLYISEYDFSLDPNFEVCMRNKGYVLASEAGYFAENPISAKTAGLRGYSQPTYTQSSYSQPAYPQTGYSYP